MRPLFCRSIYTIFYKLKRWQHSLSAHHGDQYTWQIEISKSFMKIQNKTEAGAHTQVCAYSHQHMMESIEV